MVKKKWKKRRSSKTLIEYKKGKKNHSTLSKQYVSTWKTKKGWNVSTYSNFPFVKGSRTKKFKTKAKALKSARAYMRKH